MVIRERNDGGAVVITEFDGTSSESVAALLAFTDAITPLAVVAVSPKVGEEQRACLDAGGRRDGRLSILELGAALGKGASLRAAVASTDASLVVFALLNSQIGADNVFEALDQLEAAPDVDAIVWNRYGTERSTSWRAGISRLRSGASNTVARTLFGLDVRDVHSPLKAFRRRALVQVFDHLRLYNHGFDTDMLYNAKRIGCVVEERTLRWTPSSRPPGFFKTAVGALLAIVALRLYHSPLRNLPFVEPMTAHYAIPVRRSYSIAIFCWRDPLSPKAGGSETYLFEQARCWVRQGCKVTWVTERFAGSPAEEVVDGVRFVRRGRGLLVFLMVPLWHIFESDRNYDFIIDVMNGIPFFTPLYSSKPKVCLIYHIHSEHFRDELPPLLANVAIGIEAKVVPPVYRRTSFITISESTKNDMQRLNFTNRPILTIHSGVSAELVPGRKAEKPTVLYLGRIRKYKRLRNLLVAFAEIKAQLPEAQLVIAGTGDDLEELQAIVKRERIEDVTFAGRVDDATKMRLMQEAWVFAMPSMVEGWGIVVMEAAACATPSVAYDVNGLRDCIVAGQTGVLARNDAEFVAGLRDLLQDGERRERLSAGALARSREFSWDRTARQTLRTIRLAQPWRAVFESDEGATTRLRLRRRHDEHSPAPAGFAVGTADRL